MILIPKGQYHVNFLEGADQGVGDIRLFYGCDSHSFKALFGGKGIVEIPNSFYIDKYEITNSKYKLFVDATGHKPPPYWHGTKYPNGKGNYPVLVTWSDAKAYANWIGKRLPSFDEWVAATGNLDTMTTPWMGKLDPSEAKKYRIYNASDFKPIDFIQEIGQSPSDKSPLGVYDLIGNALEWTSTPITLENETYIKLGGYYVTNEINSGTFYAAATVDIASAAPCPGILSGFRCVKDISSTKSSTANPVQIKKAENSLLPSFTQPLKGTNEVRVKNPNDFNVLVGLRYGNRGRDFDVPANGVSSVFVPNGEYEIYFVYSNKPDALFKGDDFSLNNNGVEIQIVKVVGGNYGIRQVK
jgi:hypothetical protein